VHWLVCNKLSPKRRAQQKR